MRATGHDADVFVVGGGPAGLAAAIAARQQGLSVLVADFARPPIDKACGEGLMPDSLAALAELGVSLDGLETGTFRGIRFLGDGCSVEAVFPTGTGLGIRRTLLHQAMLERAEALGVKMVWGSRVQCTEARTVLLNGDLVRYNWLIGADGYNSRIRKFAGLDNAREYDRRIGIRRHFELKQPSEYVEIYWGETCQAYVTPISANEVCVAVIGRERQSFEMAIEEFPGLAARLRGATPLTTVKGAITVSRRLRSVSSGGIALIGEASGSADAITGEGLAMCFRQAVSLGHALAGNNLREYELEHRKIMKLPHFMSRAMLLMDKSSLIRQRTMRALSAQPHLFDRMLSVHVGEIPVHQFGLGTAVQFGWQMLTA